MNSTNYKNDLAERLVNTALEMLKDYDGDMPPDSQLSITVWRDHIHFYVTNGRGGEYGTVVNGWAKPQNAEIHLHDA